MSWSQPSTQPCCHPVLLAAPQSEPLALYDGSQHVTSICTGTLGKTGSFSTETLGRTKLQFYLSGN